jgi:hypothetical protein
MGVTKCITHVIVLSLLAMLFIASDGRAQIFNLCADSSCVYLPTVRNSLPLTIQNVRIGASGLRGGYVALQGEVVNTGPRPLYDISVELTLYHGTLVEVITLDTLLTNTPPGAVNPFSIVIYADRGGAERIEARVIRANNAPDTAYLPLTVVSVQEQPAPNQGIFDIVLRNDHAVAVSTLRGIIWSFPIEHFIPVQPLRNITLQPGETYTWRPVLVCRPHVCIPRVAAEGIPVP